MNGNFRVYIFMCDECICMVHSWALGFVKLNMACEPLRIIVFFFSFLSIEIFEDYVIQDEAHWSGEAQNLEDCM